MHSLTQVTLQGCCVISNKVNFPQSLSIIGTEVVLPYSSSGGGQRDHLITKFRDDFYAGGQTHGLPTKQVVEGVQNSVGTEQATEIRLGEHRSFLILGPGNQVLVD